MDRTEGKRIEFSGIPGSKAIDRFVEKRILRWLRDQMATGYSDFASGLGYAVAFAREGHGHLIDCYVEIRAGDRLWQGSSLGNGTQQALIQSLEHMAPVPARA
jgi:hypothetical protein